MKKLDKMIAAELVRELNNAPPSRVTTMFRDQINNDPSWFYRSLRFIFSKKFMDEVIDSYEMKDQIKHLTLKIERDPVKWMGIFSGYGWIPEKNFYEEVKSMVSNALNTR